MLFVDAVFQPTEQPLRTFVKNLLQWQCIETYTILSF